MGKSGNPAKAAEQLRISQVGDFKKRIGGVMELPSGSVVKLRNPGGLQVFLQGDSIPNSLMPIVQKALNEGKAPQTESFMGKDGTFDEKLLADMAQMMDNIALKTIVEPPVEPAPEVGVERSDDILYIDEFPLEDKQFIMQWVTGGVKDLEQFRKQQQAGVASLGSIAGAASSTK